MSSRLEEYLPIQKILIQRTGGKSWGIFQTMLHSVLLLWEKMYVYRHVHEKRYCIISFRIAGMRASHFGRSPFSVNAGDA